MKRAKKILFLLAVIGVFWAGVFYRSWLPDVEWLRITDVAVTVEAPLNEGEIRKALGKLEGQNLLLLSAEEIIQRLLSNPWAAAAFIKKEYPNRIVVSVQAKKPVAARQESGRLVVLDETGAEIERWSAARATALDLPVIAFEKPEMSKVWNSKTLMHILDTFQSAIAPKYRLSQLVPADPPYFKVYLTAPALEILFSLHTWEAQLSFFVDLLSRPPEQISRARRLNLVSPKKAVVGLAEPEQSHARGR